MCKGEYVSVSVCVCNLVRCVIVCEFYASLPPSYPPSLALLASPPLPYHSHPLLLLESYRTRFLRAEGASEDAELAALAHLVEQSCKIASGGSKVQSSFPSVRGGLRYFYSLQSSILRILYFF